MKQWGGDCLIKTWGSLFTVWRKEKLDYTPMGAKIISVQVKTEKLGVKPENHLKIQNGSGKQI